MSDPNNSLTTVKHKLAKLVENSKENIEFLTDLSLSKSSLGVEEISFPTDIFDAGKPSEMDALLGAGVFLKSNQIKLKDESIVLQETV